MGTLTPAPGAVAVAVLPLVYLQLYPYVVHMLQGYTVSHFRLR